MEPTSRHGIGPHLPQFALLIGVNALVGALVGQERTLVPFLAEREFGVESAVATSAFLITFGLAKAPSNLLAGFLAARLGRKNVLVAGWLIGLPVPLLLLWAPSWHWVILANLLLGINQGFTWSATVLMKIDLAGDDQRGLAVGLNEGAGYMAVGVSAFATGLLADRYGIRFEPFLLGSAIAALGLASSVFLVRETREPGSSVRPLPGNLRSVARDPQLLACSRTGLINNANDAFAWALLPLLLLQSGRSVAEVTAIAATYPIVWGALQLVAGPLSDRIGRRMPVVAGMLMQAIGIAAFSVFHGLGSGIAAAALLGLGTALAYPALLAAAADAVPENKRPAALGFFRMWRDGGYVLGALGFGVVADAWGLGVAALVAAGATGVAGVDGFLHLAGGNSSERLRTRTMPV